MPNSNNIKSPIILISPGRSGTTLISNVFNKCPKCSSCGETVDLIFDLWNAAQRSLSHIGSDKNWDASVPADSLNAEFVRKGFLALLSDDKSLWFQKPIGIPVALSTSLFDVDSWEEKAQTYWKVMSNVFPEAKYFTILRHPCDVVMSFKRRFNFDEKTCWAILGFLAYIIDHPASLVRHAVSYDALVSDSEATLKSLLAFLDVDYCNEMIDSFQVVHSWHDKVQSSVNTEFSWKRQWGELDATVAEASFVEPIKRLYAKFGYALTLPDAISNGGADITQAIEIKAAISSNEGTMDQLRLQIENLQMEAIKLNASWDERAIRQENEFQHAFKVLTKQINELTEGKAWVEQQFQSWQRTAEQRELLLKEIEEGNAWLKQQIQAWEKSTRDLESGIDAFRRHPAIRVLQKLRIVRWKPQHAEDDLEIPQTSNSRF